MLELNRAAADVDPAVRAERRDGRHRLRAARPRARAGLAERRARGLDARRFRRCPARSSSRERCAHGRRPPEPRVRGGHVVESERVRARPRRSRTTRRPPGACSCRCPASGPPSSRRRSRRRASPRCADRQGREGRESSFASGGRGRRARSVSARTFLRIALASCVALFLVITSGAFVRLTGLGARLRELAELRRQAVPRAGLPRVRRVREPDGRARRHRPHARRLARVAVDERALALGAVGALGAFLVAIAQIPMGGHHDRARPPSARGDDALPARLAAFGLALIAVLEAWSLRDGLAGAAGAGWLRRSSPGSVCPACVALVVTGAVATASGPASGLERGGGAARRRDRGHGLRARARRGRVRDRRPRRRVAPRRMRPRTRGCSGSGSASWSCSSRRRSSARCSTATRSRGGSCSSTSSSRPRSGRSASRSRSRSGARLGRLTRQ